MDAIDSQDFTKTYETPSSASPEDRKLADRSSNNSLSAGKVNQMLVLISTIFQYQQLLLESTQKFQTEVDQIGISPETIEKIESLVVREAKSVRTFLSPLKNECQELLKLAKKTTWEKQVIACTDNYYEATKHAFETVTKVAAVTAQIRDSS